MMLREIGEDHGAQSGLRKQDENPLLYVVQEIKSTPWTCLTRSTRIVNLPSLATVCHEHEAQACLYDICHHKHATCDPIVNAFRTITQ
jgi:hypothetical protein